MGSAEEVPREAESHRRPERQEEDTPPAYEQFERGPSTASNADAPPATPESTPSKPTQASGPSIDSPFNFPAPPAYAAPESGAASPSAARLPVLQRPIAIPQRRADAASPLLPAYAPALLRAGIPAASFHAFQQTVSAFLSATVPARALAHAGDMARTVGAAPASFGRATADHVKQEGRAIGASAKRGNVLGAAADTLGAAIRIPVGTALRAVAAVVQTPASVVAAAASRPRTPRQRAEAYVAVADRDWFAPRGLRARILDTQGLAGVLGLRPHAVVEDMRAAAKGGPETQMQMLGTGVEPLEFADTQQPVDVGLRTLWLVVSPSRDGDGDGAVAGDKLGDDRSGKQRERSR
ncbi:hypothetical protein F4780DRAFT_785420 [Xylariomycetidae sp. FL0641]|nr:hypothetical protein F4780DRAFT_785420 [Xylariomycetidae sp. FL0641]